MTSHTRWPLPVSDKVRGRLFLDRVCAEPRLQARFLNTLSLLEHIGSRKIMVSQSRSDRGLDRGTLKHLAEEARHAFFLKRVAETIARKKLSYDADDILAGPQVRLYIGRLDAFIARSVRGVTAYLYMSLVIELRAVWLYQIFEDVLQKMDHSVKLTSLLAEENQHLKEMQLHLHALGEDIDDRIPSFASFEETLFLRMLTALECAVSRVTANERTNSLPFS